MTPDPSNRSSRVHPIGKLITAYMQERGISTLPEFAASAELSQTTIYDLIRPSSNKYPSLPTLVQLAKVLERPTHELLYLFAPDAPGAPVDPSSTQKSAKDRLREIGQHLPDTATFLQERKKDVGEW
ncbi:helix-turn-helix domain-containing protein (plasmid) [Deinococcus sp. VB343]|uniref:Helix-turn-helix transcriptional regulator n=1 Tax=Deinococcus sp. VB142 TaxID=3112952 RepID=A0AAU6Q711_9DEIO